MEVLQVLHMNKGVGEASYAINSTLQNKIISMVKPTTKEALTKTLCYTIPESMGIADLVCSSGPNALVVISEIIDVVHGLCHPLDRPMPELRVHLNDLPSNDFNNIFGSLPEFYNRLKQEKGSELGPCFVSAVPGSFYGRLFPSKSLHFVHSSSSLRWLSQVPTALDCNAKQALNKGKIYISKTSPISVMEAYAEQFQKDFSVFLKSRSEEIVSGGQMVLSFMGRRSLDPTTEESCYHWELLAQALMSMVSEGRVDEEKVDSFNAPYYAPCPEELETEVQKEGSFIIDSLEAFEIDWDADNNEIIYGGENNAQYQRLTSGQRVAKTIRAVVESMLECQFGGDIMDDLFHRYSQIVGDHLSKRRTKYINLVVSLIKQG